MPEKRPKNSTSKAELGEAAGESSAAPVGAARGRSLSAAVVTTAGAGSEGAARPGRYWPALLDHLQGVSGLFLVLFMWAHMFAVSSILLGKDAMYRVARFFEGSLFFEEPQPWLVSLVALAIFALFALHTMLALRKIPQGYRQWRAWWRHMRGMRHEETTLWLLQVITGLVLMFFVTAHLLEIFLHPADIGPHASAARIAGGGWVLGLVLLFAVEVHAGIGLYRLIVKWGWFGFVDSAQRRLRLRRFVYGLVAFFLILGLTTQLAYLRIGNSPEVQAGERYAPVSEVH